MSIFPNLFFGDMPRFGEQGEGLRSSFHRTWFDSAGAQTHPWFCNQHQQGVDGGRVGRGAALLPSHPNLDRMFGGKGVRYIYSRPASSQFSPPAMVIQEAIVQSELK